MREKKEERTCSRGSHARSRTCTCTGLRGVRGWGGRRALHSAASHRAGGGPAGWGLLGGGCGVGEKPVLEAPPAPPTPCFAPLRNPHRWLMHFHFTHRLSPPPPVPTGPEGCRPGFCLLSSLRALSYTTEGGKGARATLALRGRGSQRAGGPLHQGVLAAVAELTLLPQASAEAVTQRASRKLARVQINSRRNEH